jgi:Helix-turn-helix domain
LDSGAFQGDARHHRAKNGISDNPFAQEKRRTPILAERIDTPDSGSPDMKPPLLNPEQAAKVLQMDSRTLVYWARRGYVPAHPMGEGKRKMWRFLEHELLEWIKAQNHDSRKRPPASTMKTAISAHARRTAA